MKILFRSVCVAVGMLFIMLQGCSNSKASQAQTVQQGELYQCLPCGYDCDKTTYKESGTCPQCHMQLVKTSSVTFRSIAPADICAFIKNHPRVVLLDVRTREEFEQKATPNYGTLKNAINLPVQEFEKKLSEINNLKDKEILVYCSHSHRSPMASYILTQHGFTKVTNLAGGMSVVSDTACKK